MVAFYLKQDAFAFDVETVGSHRGVPAVNEVLWISLATNGRTDVIAMGHPNGALISSTLPLTGQGQKRVEAGLTARDADYSRDKSLATLTFSEPPLQLSTKEVFEVLKPLMFNESITKVGHNLVFDVSSIAKYYNGEVIPGPYFDTMVGSFIYDNRNKGKCGLADCLERELGFKMVKGVGVEVEKHDFDTVATYAFLDAKYTWELQKVVRKKLTEANVWGTMDLEMDVLGVLCSMKLTGIPLDIKALQELQVSLSAEIENTKALIFKTAGRQFNLNSNADKQEVLFGNKKEGGRGLKPKSLTAGSKKKGKDDLTIYDYQVTEQVLKDFAEEDELAGQLIKYNELNKLYSTYVIPYLGGEVVRTAGGKARLEHKDSLLINGCIYCDFIQNGADTGRFSSRNPNLQNVPAPYTPNGKAIRNLFTAPVGHKLIVADYSQIEPRVIASLSKDENLINNYKNGTDLYTVVGNEMEVDRKVGKTLVLAMAYGVGSAKIALDLGVSRKEALDLIERFKLKFPKLLEHKTKVVYWAYQQKPIPYIETKNGRRRYLPDLKSKDPNLKARGERQAYNTRIQGTAADIIKLAMYRAHLLLPKEAKIALTIHDELVTITPTHLVDEAVAAIREAMEGVKMIEVPLIADIVVVDRWGEAKE
jgi:DNA polymerase I-like protein with 3'-5' exonuclease and polymerase domains